MLHSIPFFNLRFCYAYTPIALVFLLVSSHVLQAQAGKKEGKKRAKSELRLAFEYAYSIEKEAPRRAIYIYKSLIKQTGRKKTRTAQEQRDLRSIASWHLLYLYEQNKQYMPAVLALGHMARKYSTSKTKTKQITKLMGRLHDKIKKKWALDKASWDYLRVALKALRLRKNQAGQKFIHVLRLRPRNLSLRRAVLRLLLEEQGSSQALAVLNELSTYVPELNEQNEYILDYASLQLQDGNLAGAKTKLLSLIQSDTELKNEQQMQVYYLMGRMERQDQKYAQAARYFQTAAHFVSEQRRRRMNVSAAYCWYLNQEFSKAFSLLEQQGAIGRHLEAYILMLVLRVKLHNNAAAKKELRSLVPYLRMKSKDKATSKLARDALTVL